MSECEKVVFVNSSLGPNHPWCNEHDEPWESCIVSLHAEVERAQLAADIDGRTLAIQAARIRELEAALARKESAK